MTITTKTELKKAIANKEKSFVVTGGLAKKLLTAKAVTALGAVTLVVTAAAIAAATAAAPATGGLSYALAAPIAAQAGVNVPAIIAASVLGIGLVIALFRNYDVEVEYYPSVRLKCTKR